MEEVINLNEIRKNIKPFDIICFKGSDGVSGIISGVQKYFLGSGEISHVGMVVTKDILPYYNIKGDNFFLDEDEIYVFESTIPYSLTIEEQEVVPDAFTEEPKLGAQIRKLEEVIRVYLKDEGSSVGWCKLIKNPYTEESKEIISETFQKIFADYYSRMYDLSFISLASAVFPKMRGIRAVRDFIFYTIYKLTTFFGLSTRKNFGPLGWQFCSELIANVYIKMGIIDPKTDPRNVTPIDFFGFDQDGLDRIVENPIYLSTP